MTIPRKNHVKNFDAEENAYTRDHFLGVPEKTEHDFQAQAAKNMMKKYTKYTLLRQHKNISAMQSE